MGAETSAVMALLFLAFLVVSTVGYSAVDYSKNLVKNAQYDQDTMKKTKMQTDITITNVTFTTNSGNLYLNITLQNTGKTTLNTSLLDIFIDGVYSPSYILSTGNTLAPENSTNISFYPSGAITLDNAGANISNSSTKVLNLTSFAIGSGTNRLLVVGLNYNNTPGTTSTVKYNNTDLTLAMRANNSNKNYTELWYLVNPPSGSYNISHNQTNATQMVMGAWSYTGVDQVTPIGNITNATGTSTNSNVSITTTVANSVLVDVETDGSTLLTVGAGQTQRYKANTTKINGGGSEMSTSAAGTYNMNWALGSSAAWVNIGAEIRPYLSNTVNSTISRIKVVTENGISDYALES
ncbi:MAG: hypothetical protein ABOK23_08315 [Candidatus Methanoperedens sp.]|nr:hypothetical protein [Candidatus Methanoperedens sp.]MCZ7396369.1 hypothetical protein [Candidatus Methanoperedens sp.]